ncbi:carboxypeptidase-like regulatory domain-containing protein, partial [Nocardioides ferulae]|uniref:carboxypeptidase-like regulatory domain-containing protein n=1 Tax=Nocardioides ferulae TaxID=2340821 RepID=UPI0013DD895E
MRTQLRPRPSTQVRAAARLLVALLSAVLLTAGLATPSQAAVTTISGRVTIDGDGSVVGATVKATDPSGGATLASTGVDATGRYALSVDAAQVDLVVTPPPGSGYQPAVVRGIETSRDQTVDVKLVPQEAVTWTGVLRDGAGDPLPHADLYLLQDT